MATINPNVGAITTNVPVRTNAQVQLTVNETPQAPRGDGLNVDFSKAQTSQAEAPPQQAVPEESNADFGGQTGGFLGSGATASAATVGGLEKAAANCGLTLSRTGGLAYLETLPVAELPGQPAGSTLAAPGSIFLEDSPYGVHSLQGAQAANDPRLPEALKLLGRHLPTDVLDPLSEVQAQLRSDPTYRVDVAPGAVLISNIITNEDGSKFVFVNNGGFDNFEAGQNLLQTLKDRAVQAPAGERPAALIWEAAPSEEGMARQAGMQRIPGNYQQPPIEVGELAVPLPLYVQVLDPSAPGIVRDAAGNATGMTSEAVKQTVSSLLNSYQSVNGCQDVRPLFEAFSNSIPQDEVRFDPSVQHTALREVTDLRPPQYAAAARSALLSYLPKEDVDSKRAMQGYLKDPTYQHSLWQSDDGGYHYISGFAHDLGSQGRCVQLDYHSLVEGNPPDLAGGKMAFERFLEQAGGKLGKADYLFVEVTPEMAALYKQIEPGFTEFAPPGTQCAGDQYTLLALPTSPEASTRLRDHANEVFHAYVDSWFDKNLGTDWKTSQPDALPAYQEMTQSARPVWSQPPLPG